MVKLASRVLGKDPNAILQQFGDYLQENHLTHEEAVETRTIQLELPAAAWAALDAIARAENSDEGDGGLSVAIMHAVESRFTARELATMVAGGRIRGVWGIQRAMEGYGRDKPPAKD
jgi:hypothetical protein